MKNRLEVYESLVELCLLAKNKPDSTEESFRYIEMAKSRSLAELLMRSGPALPVADGGHSDLVRRIREMREELNWYYRRIELEQLRAEEPSPERIEKLQKEALAHENELLHVLREVPQAGDIVQQGPAMSSLAAIRAALPPDAALVEYFSLKDQFIAAIITRETIEIVPLTPVSRSRESSAPIPFSDLKIQIGRGLRADVRNIHAGFGAGALAPTLRRSAGPAARAPAHEAAPRDRAARRAALSSVSRAVRRCRVSGGFLHDFLCAQRQRLRALPGKTGAHFRRCADFGSAGRAGAIHPARGASPSRTFCRARNYCGIGRDGAGACARRDCTAG